MFQLRIYTLRSPEALNRYATVHWARHLATFTTFGVTTHGVWTQRSDGANRLVALIRYPQGADPEQLTRHAMTSPEFAAEFPRVFAAIPGERIQNLPVQDRSLNTGNSRRVAEGGV